MLGEALHERGQHRLDLTLGRSWLSASPAAICFRLTAAAVVPFAAAAAPLAGVLQFCSAPVATAFAAGPLCWLPTSLSLSPSEQFPTFPQIIDAEAHSSCHGKVGKVAARTGACSCADLGHASPFSRRLEPGRGLYARHGIPTRGELVIHRGEGGMAYLAGTRRLAGDSGDRNRDVSAAGSSGAVSRFRPA